MPGYNDKVIMAAGAFVQGSSIEAFRGRSHPSALRRYFQGGLTWNHAKIGILMSLQKMADAGLGNIINYEIRGRKNELVFGFPLLPCCAGPAPISFSKIGCRDASDKYSQYKMVTAVGVVMGIHAAIEIFVGGVEISWQVIWTYLPVSLLYIGSMTLGYVGLRYIELSISSPICNASGALVAIIAIVSGTAGKKWRLLSTSPFSSPVPVSSVLALWRPTRTMTFALPGRRLPITSTQNHG